MAGISSKAYGELPNNELYGNKEIQNEEFTGAEGLELYDFSARVYDQQTGHFINIDPLSEKFYELSSFHYSYNNPIRFGDPTEMAGISNSRLLQRKGYFHRSVN